jgi:sulfate adenylyltransferase
MTDNKYNFKPHGGKLIDLMADEDRSNLLKEMSLNLQDISLNDRQLCDLELLATGVFSPLEGFMNRPDYESVLDRMRLQNDLLWPIPICLDISQTQARSIEIGQSIALRDPEGFLLAVLHIEDMWQMDKEQEASQIYGTLNPEHPGVSYIFSQLGEYYVGGKLEVLSLPIHFDFKNFRRIPKEICEANKRLGWKRIVGFQTRHPLHRPQFEVTLHAMRECKANLLLLPIAGITKPGDFDHYTRVRCYRAVTRHYPPDSFILNLLPLAIRMAGPRDGLLDAIISKNFGCTHFIVGYDHAGPGADSQGNAFYEKRAAQELTKSHSKEIGIEILDYDEMVYIPFEDEYRFASQVPENTQTISLSGSEIRKRFSSGKRLPEWVTFPEVIEELQKAYPPAQKQGLTIFMTGFSGSGKSTIAKILYSRFLEIGDRPVTLLDGDIVRHSLSSELSFSKEHRDINVRRIGFVAGEITKNRGIAICAPIAPYERTREEIRSIIESYGGFIEVHVSTPIEECERRDRKGMYAKAKAGLIKGFTGVDAPYEVPESPEIRIDTTHLTPIESAREILLYLGQKSYI